MHSTLVLPELKYLSPTTRERAIIITQELLSTGGMSPKEAVSRAILIAKDWAVKNVNRKVWKKLKSNDKESYEKL